MKANQPLIEGMSKPGPVSATQAALSIAGQGYGSGSRRGRQSVALLCSIAIMIGVGAVVARVLRWSRRSESVSAVFSEPSSAVTRQRVAKYVGPAACAECHPGESALQARSGHDRTLRPAELSPIIEWLNGKSVADPKYQDVHWSYQVRDQRLIVERTADGKTESLPLDFGVGSGKHGVTFVAMTGDKTGVDPAGIEHRLSYFPHEPRLDITPGQEKSPRDRPKGDTSEAGAFGRTLPPDRFKGCIRCHATATSPTEPFRFESATLLPNVSCERCHGPAGDHVAAARRGETDLSMKLGHDRGQPWTEVNLCGECHRLPRAVADSEINPANPGIVRFQGVGISMSACYAKGEGSLRCTTCHDPHDRASSDHGHYEAACLSCHQATGVTQKACPVSPRGGCVDCHMPRREIAGNGLFTDHWIRRPLAKGAESVKSQRGVVGRVGR
jgi:hypothetical protein